jgi:hypothetical protein
MLPAQPLNYFPRKVRTPKGKPTIAFLKGPPTRQLAFLAALEMSALNIKEPAIPFGSRVVISGVSGFIGSHVADQALAAGYKVRGTTQDVRKSDWIKKHFEETYGPGNFELVEVRDMAAEGAFDKAVVGTFYNPFSSLLMSIPNKLRLKAPLGLFT